LPDFCIACFEPCHSSIRVQLIPPRLRNVEWASSMYQTFERNCQGDSSTFRTLLNIYMCPSVRLEVIKISNERAFEIIILLEVSPF
jgi:hypothetical protein